MIRALEAIVTSILESLGIELGKFLLGEFFIALLLTSLITFPVSAGLVDLVTERLKLEYGSFLYNLVALFIGAPIVFGVAILAYGLLT
ncbi:hypothetical protein [Actibacterium pelagium]|uniref:Uncharacterized protein n=1 Tax=Actibacterium pelagium TaxID=2029103 RepID=A0A917ACT1_9RHOB|nr:hypothetical protein [Actibacterium pelagium]GGE41984.1 hypothetical protein GCM10011517_06980 [Actibacterium pelagium]